MGFYPQPNDWSCGPFALKHALVALGSLADEEEISAVVRPHWWAGADEVRLARAARAFGCDMLMVRRRDAERARKTLVRYLRQRFPVLLCVDQWGHWITVVRHEGARFVVFDSNLDPVLNVLTWPQLRNRWRFYDYEADEDDPPEYYDLHPVKPRYSGDVPAHLSVARAQFLRRPENEYLSLYWDAYLEDLLEICRRRSTRMTEPLSMGEFLRRYQDTILGRVTYWHGGVDRDAVRRILRNFRFVAETYGLVIPAAHSRRALIDVSILTSFWVCSRYGVGDMYGTGDHNGNKRKPARRRRRS